MATKETKSEPKNDNRQAPELQECFVIMPISDQPGYDAGHFHKVYEDIFKPACISAGYNATRADGVKDIALYTSPAPTQAASKNRLHSMTCRGGL